MFVIYLEKNKNINTFKIGLWFDQKKPFGLVKNDIQENCKTKFKYLK